MINSTQHRGQTEGQECLSTPGHRLEQDWILETIQRMNCRRDSSSDQQGSRLRPVMWPLVRSNKNKSVWSKNDVLLCFSSCSSTRQCVRRCLYRTQRCLMWRGQTTVLSTCQKDTHPRLRIQTVRLSPPQLPKGGHVVLHNNNIKQS